MAAPETAPLPSPRPARAAEAVPATAPQRDARADEAVPPLAPPDPVAPQADRTEASTLAKAGSGGEPPGRTAIVPEAGLARLPRPRPADAAPAAGALAAAGFAGREATVFQAGPAADRPSGEAVPADTPGASAAAPSAPAASSAAGAIEELARLPHPRPARLAPGALALVAPDAEPDAPEPPIAPPIPQDIVDDGGAACLDRLRKLGVAFKREAAIDPGGACPVANPLSVTAIGSGVELTSTATMNCLTAEATAIWVRDIMVPQAREHLGARPTAIVPGSTYACRPRNNQSGARLSEHAQANAFDVMSITFADREPLEIRARGSSDPEGKFQMAIRQGSCAFFTTVLGPGSDAAHATHLHFDLARRRGGFRLCDMGDGATMVGRK